jgi:hypothetical protein
MEATCPWINQLAKLLRPLESLMQEVFPDYFLYLLVPVSTPYSWLLANIMTESFSCFQKCDKISGNRFSMMVLLEILVVDYYNVHTYRLEMIKSVGSYGNSSLLFIMKGWRSDILWATLVRLCLHFIVVVKISLQSHKYVQYLDKRVPWIVVLPSMAYRNSILAF